MGVLLEVGTERVQLGQVRDGAHDGTVTPARSGAAHGQAVLVETLVDVPERVLGPVEHLLRIRVEVVEQRLHLKEHPVQSVLITDREADRADLRDLVPYRGHERRPDELVDLVDRRCVAELEGRRGEQLLALVADRVDLDEEILLRRRLDLGVVTARGEQRWSATATATRT